MKTELLIVAVTAFFIANIYHDGKYVTMVKSWKKYYQMAGIAFAGVSAYAFLKKNRISINQIGSLYVNRGPGSFAGIRTSLSIVKGIHFTKKIDYFSFSYSDFVNEDKKKINNWIEVPSLCKKYKIKKNLINPLYLS